MNYTCNTCGNVFEDSLGVCPSCGTPVSVAQPQQTQPQQQPYQQPQQAQPQQQPYQQPYQQGYQQPYQQGYQYSGAPVYAQNGEAKSKLAAGLLGIFLGWLGVHNFYLGFTGKAIAQLLISVLSCFTLSFVSGIWGLIEGILILTGSMNVDANGMQLTE